MYTNDYLSNALLPKQNFLFVFQFTYTKLCNTNVLDKFVLCLQKGSFLFLSTRWPAGDESSIGSGNWYIGLALCGSLPHFLCFILEFYYVKYVDLAICLMSRHRIATHVLSSPNCISIVWS